MFKNIVRRVLSGLLAVMMLVSDISVPAYADITSPESTEPTGTVTADAEHPASGENDVDLVRELLVTPIGTNSFYKVEEDDYTGSEYVPGYKVVYADRELDEDYHAIASDVINTASGSDYGMMASSDGKKVAYMLLSECRTTKTAPKLYLYCHATEDGATVSNSTDNFFNVTDDADSNDMMSTQVSINVRRVYDPEGNVTERVVRASSLDSRVNYDVTIATKRAYQLKATVPMYVCMYGYRGTGSIITPDSSVYSINNYSTIKQSDNATVNDIVKVTEMTVMKDDDHGADTVYAVGCLDEAAGVYYYWFSKPSDGDSATKEGITKTVAELKATGAYHVMTAEEKTNASGKTAVCYIDNDEDGTKEWLFKKSGDLRNNKYLMETVSEIKQGDYELKSNLVVDNFDFDTYFATKQTGESLTDERYEGMRMQVTSVTAKPTSWTLVPMSTINKKAGEIAMSISPVGIVENSSAVDLSEASNGYDVTAASWCIEASECDKETGSVEPDDAQKLGLKVKASMAGSNLNAEGCFPAVTVTYTVAPVVNDDPLRHDLLLGIRIASAPTLMTYRHGDTLNREGMVVMATYEEAGEKEIVGYGIEGKLEAGQTSATIYYDHEGEIKTATLDGLTVENYLTGLKVTSAPLTTTYKDGETFDDTGMTVYKEYANGDEVVTTDYTVSNAKGGTVDAPLAYGQKNVILTCKEAGETVFTSQSINVQDALTGLEITHAPYKTAYSVGDTFDTSGMVVTAHYASGTSKAVTGYTLSATTIASGMDKITVSYTEDEVTKTVDQPIVSDNVLSNIEVTTAPDATEYFDGDDFDTTGMVVTACYTNGTKAAVTGYTVTDGTGLTAGKENVTISFTKDGVTKTCKQAISVTYKLTGIEITTAPSKTAYKYGDNFETKGMVVQAEYSNGSKKVVSEYTVTDGSNLATGKADVTVSYTEKGVTKTVKQGITVEKVLTSISATTAPTKTAYLHGEDFDKTGMVITAIYSDATKAAVTGYTVTDGTGMKYGKTGVTVSYTEKGITKKCTVNITVNNGLDSIYVSTNPTKTNYNPGDNFDKTGMVITAKYGNGTSKAVAGYVVTGGSALTLASKSVTISYTESGITKTCKQSITVNDVLDSIEITTAPTKVAYQAGEDFDTTGMVVKAKYTSGASKTLTTYAVGNGKNLVQGRTGITISYSENGVTKTADQAITVSDEIMSIAIETPPDKTDYLHGESFSTTGMVISGTYKSGAKIAVSGYTHDGDYLEIGDDKVTISYKENGKTVKCTQAITVGPVAYTMLLGENSVVNATADSTFRSAAPYSEFKSVTVDGDTLAATDYTKSEGSTVIKLKKEYIETLSGDVHELIIYSKGGTTSCNFYIENISLFYKISGSTLYIRATEETGYTERDLTGNCENGWINNTSITSVVFEEPVEPVSCAHFFDGCSNITSFSNLSDFHGERAASMAYMFRGFKSLDGFDLTKLETSNATNMSYMFQNCSADELDLSNFNTENVTAMTGMFSGCTKLEKVTLSGGFEFVGTNGYLPVISDSNVSGADGKWYTKEDDAYTPAQLAALSRSSTVTYYSVPPAITTLTLEKAPTKTTYLHGEAFDKTGAVVKATNEYGFTKDVSSLVNWDTTINSGMTEATGTFRNKKVTTPVAVSDYLDSIAVTTAPTKTEYKYGDDFDTAGMVVTATMASGAEKTVSGFTVTDGTNLKLTDTEVTISYTEGSVTKTCKQAVTVSDYLTSVKTESDPTKTEYNAGDNFDAAGMVVKAVYASGAEKTVTGYTVEGGTPLTAGQTTVTVKFTDGGIEKTCTVYITVKNPLTSIEVTTPPTKTEYKYGEDFVKAGMVVTATYASGATKTVNVTVTDGKNLTVDKTNVTLSYTENGATKTCTQDITVTDFLTGISVTTAPTKTTYQHGDDFDSTGMVVKAAYAGGGSKTITPTVINGTNLAARTESVTLSYTEGGVTKTCAQAITVNDILKSITIETAPTKVNYSAGEDFDATGMVIKATYESGYADTVTATATNGTNLTSGQTEVTLSYTENGVTKTVEQNITVGGELSGISVTTAPTKTAYKHGDNFDSTGMVVTASYTGGGSKTITDYTVTDGTSLTAGKTTVTLSYTDGGITKTCTQDITVADVLTGISVTTAPTKTAYKYGDTFDKTGMVVTANYASGASKPVTGYTTSPTTALTLTDTSIAISYTEDGVTKNASQTITVADVLTGISVTTAPTKTAYKYGDTFSKTGMVVTANYASGASKAVTDYTTSPTTALTLSDTSIAISYTEDGVTKNASQTITVADVLTGVEVTAAPTKTAYKHGDDFDSTGITVTATMASGAKKTVTATATDGTSLTAGKTDVTLSYTENGVTKTCKQTITVADVLTGISVTTAPTKTAYKYGDTFDKAGMVVTAKYASGASKAVTGYTTSPTTALTLSDTSITISYTEDGITKNASQTITVADVLTGVEVTAAPTKTAYKHGDDFVSTGMTVKATYASGASKTVTATATDGTNLTAGKTSVTLSFTEGGVTKTCTQAITVADVLTGVSVTTAPTKTAYKHGDDFASAGMVVTANYASGASKPVTATVTDGTSLTAGKTDVTLSYTENGVTKTCKQNITVADVLTGISVTTAPTKTVYKHGDTFDKTGMVVNASYASGASKAVTGYTTSPTTALTLSDTSISISYTENGVTKNASQAITVSDYLSKIEITTAPTKTAYKHGDNFVSTGMAVKATMASGATSTISDYTVTDGTSLTAGKTSVTLSYTAGGVTKTCTQAITVADVLSGISVTTAPTKTSYIIKDNFDKTGMVVKASYASGASKNITGYTVTDGTNLTAGKASVTLSYTEGGVTKTCTQAITVINAWEVPTGCTYTTVGGTTYNAGDLIPETYTAQVGDTYADSDYTYKYNQYFSSTSSSWTNDTSIDGWGVKVTDNTKSSYKEIASCINNKFTKNLNYTFQDCAAMITSPGIPTTIEVMTGCFERCTSLTTMPTIPDSVIYMNYAFNKCSALATATTIPSSVTNIKNLFAACGALSGSIIIDTTPTEYSNAFKNCANDSAHIITLSGSSTNLGEIKATGYSSGKYIAPFNVVWKSQDGTTALETDTGVAYNTAPSYGAAAPTKTADTNYTYAFAGWSTSTNSESGTAAASLPKVTCDTVYYAAFSKTPNAVSVTWVDGNGNTLKTDSVSYGSTPSYSGSTPTKTSTAQYDYTFTGWSPTVGAVTTATTYTAQFSSTTRKYNITWVDGDGNTLKTDSVAYGTTPSYSGSTPTKTETNSYAYTFTGWSPTVAAVTGAATYTAQFSSTAKYAIKWVDGDGNTLKTDYVKSGTKPSYTGDTPTKSPTTSLEYTFTGWSPTIANATANATYTATFSSSERKCTITVLVNDASYGTVSVSSYRIKYGYYISASSNSLKYGSSSNGTKTTFTTATAASDASGMSYSFSQWTKDGTKMGSSGVKITSDITVVANFTASAATYTVTVKCSSTEGSLSGGTGTSSSSKTVKNVPYGTVITSSGNKVTINGTTVTATGKSGSGTTYTFSNWTNGSATVTGDITVTANFSSTTATYTVSVASNNTNYGTVNASSISSVPHNSSISISGNTMTINGTTVTATPKSGYYFKAWSVGNGDKVTKNMSVTATFEAEVLTGISVTTPPSQTTYNVGDSFNTSGMVVTATYKSGATKAITPTVLNGANLSQDALDALYHFEYGFGESIYNVTDVGDWPYNSDFINTSYNMPGSAYQGTITKSTTSSGYKMSLTPTTTGTTGNYYIQRTYSGSKLNEMKNYGAIVYMNANVTTSGANYTAPCIIIAKSDWSSTVCVSNFLTSTGNGTAYINLSDYSFDNSTNYVIGWGMMATTGTVTFTMTDTGIVMFGMNTQTIQMCYTENGVTKWCQTNVTVDTDETVILDGATTTAAGGKWVSGGVTMVNVGAPTFSNGVKLYPKTYYANTFHGCLAWSGKKVNLTAGQKIAVTLNEGYTFTCPYDTNLAYGAFTGEKFYVVLSPNATNLNGNFHADTYLTDNGATLYQYAVAQHPYYNGTVIAATIAAGTYTVTVTQSGSYYVGLLAEGYDTSKTISTGNISKVVVN